MKQGMALESLLTDIDEVALDKKSGYLVLPLYNGIHGEIGLLLEYTILVFNHLKQEQKLNAKIFLCLAFRELEHVKILKKLLTKLGIEPIDTVRESYLLKRQIKNAKCLILDVIVKVKMLISELEKINSRLKNEKVKSVLKKIQYEEAVYLQILTKQLINNFLS